MPTYEFVCLACGTHVEVYQRITDEPLRECGVCGGQLRKVFHPAGILFKGSGFYATDSRSSRKKAAEGAGASGDSKGSPAQEKPEASGKGKAVAPSDATPASTDAGGTKEKSA